MCRIFNAETARLEKLNKASDFNVHMNHNNQKKQEHNRMKRNVNPALTENAYDMERVERIVDKLYDDMEEHGQKVTYRQRRINTVTTDKTIINTTARRLFFAPAELLGPVGYVIDNGTSKEEEHKKPAITAWHKKWKHGIVPYFIDPNTYGYKKYFAIRPDDALSSLPYDYASVLHYPARAFSKNGQATILTKGDIKIGQRELLSKIDVEKVGIIYDQECLERNRQYLLRTCPSVVKVNNTEPKRATEEEINSYFKDRIWPLGMISYKLRDRLEFSTEERENIKAVIRHIEKETCIKFNDLTETNDTKVVEPTTTTIATNSNKTNKLKIESNEITTPGISDNEIKESDISDIDKSVITRLSSQENSEESQQIEKEMKEKLPPAAAAGFPYDYQSVMHYPWLQIKNGVTSIMYPIWNDGWAMGHWQGLSSTDVQKLNRIYAGQCTKYLKLANADEYR
ncbi:unnamed protein product [Parnassius apollo]|uniref:(apollo) hypothetical protein n=1 Tax=Parnassius apollo TaxID=110799 RepID=A0A8S3XYF6_PARAO|nr:unnamed protein product [Parnassius apollo]